MPAPADLFGEGKTRLSIEIEGLAAIMRKLKFEPLIGGPWREAMEAIGERGEQASRAGGPRGTTGELVNKLQHKVQRRPVPLYVMVKTTARNKGFSYPRLLEYSPKHGRIGWMHSALERMWGGAGRILDEAADKIERKWRS